MLCARQALETWVSTHRRLVAKELEATEHQLRHGHPLPDSLSDAIRELRGSSEALLKRALDAFDNRLECAFPFYGEGGLRCSDWCSAPGQSDADGLSTAPKCDV